MHLSEEFAKALQDSPDGVVQFEGADGETVWLLSQRALETRNEVLKGLEQADQGESTPWDLEAFLIEARERRSRQK